MVNDGCYPLILDRKELLYERLDMKRERGKTTDYVDARKLLAEKLPGPSFLVHDFLGVEAYSIKRISSDIKVIAVNFSQFTVLILKYAGCLFSRKRPPSITQE